MDLTKVEMFENMEDPKTFIGKNFEMVSKCSGKYNDALFTIDGVLYNYPTILFRLVTPEDIYDKSLIWNRLSIFVNSDNIITNIGYF
jgi:hypothetical protein